MAELDKIVAGKIKHTGLFVFKEAYNFFYEMLEDYGYIIAEKEYAEKITPNGKDVKVEWYVWRKISEYFKFVLKIRIFCEGLSKQEVQGKAYDKGAVKVEINGFLEKDYESRWESHPFQKFLRDIYDRYIIRNRIEGYEDRISEEVDESLSQLKTFLSLEAKREA